MHHLKFSYFNLGERVEILFIYLFAKNLFVDALTSFVKTTFHTLHNVAQFSVVQEWQCSSGFS